MSREGILKTLTGVKASLCCQSLAALAVLAALAALSISCYRDNNKDTSFSFSDPLLNKRPFGKGSHCLTSGVYHMAWARKETRSGIES